MDKSVLKAAEKPMTHTEARDFIALCIDKKVTILGVERFVKSDQGLSPDINGIADFSSGSSETGNDCYSDALAYLEGYGEEKEELFEFVVS